MNLSRMSCFYLSAPCMNLDSPAKGAIAYAKSTGNGYQHLGYFLHAPGSTDMPWFYPTKKLSSTAGRPKKSAVA
jgi:hypothetical protein